MSTVVRLGALALGSMCAGLGCYGAYEFAYRLEGMVTYLVLAAPVIAATAALIPPIAEVTWREGAPLKALLWWAILVRLVPWCSSAPPSASTWPKPVLRQSAVPFAAL